MDSEKAQALQKAFEDVNIAPVINVPAAPTGGEVLDADSAEAQRLEWIKGRGEVEVDYGPYSRKLHEDLNIKPEVGYVGGERRSGDDTVEFFAQKVGEGIVRSATFVPDAFIQSLGWGMGLVARELGFDAAAKDLENPVTIYDVVRTLYEAPQGIEEAITGEPARWMTGDISPRKPKTDSEAFFGDMAFMAGGALSLPAQLVKIFGYAAKNPKVQQLLHDAGSRGVDSVIARKYAATATKAPNIGKALVMAADQYALRFASGLGRRPKRTLAQEALFGGTAGAGFGLPHFFDDKNAKIELDLGEGIGTIDIKPTLQVLASLGLPVAVAFTPSGWVINAGKDKAAPFISKVYKAIKSFSGDLFAGMHPAGQYNLASRIVRIISDDAWAMETVFLPAVEQGLFRPRTITLSNGEVVPATGGLAPDTIQALRQLGIEQPSIITMNNFLRGKGNNAYKRMAENKARADKLSSVLEDMKNRIQAGDETAPFDYIKRTLKSLDDLDSAEVQKTLDDFVTIRNQLDPEISAEDLSTVAVSLLERAYAKSQAVETRLWAPENIGTDSVQASGLGDWAASVISQAGRSIQSTPGWKTMLQLAGRRRLDELGITESGKPIKETQAGRHLEEEDLGPDGLFDIFGSSGINAAPVKIHELKEFRTNLWDQWRVHKNAGEATEALRTKNIIEHIDNEIMVEENLIFQNGRMSAQHLTNLRIARAYTHSQFERYGDKTAIGKFLNNPSSEAAVFFKKFLPQGQGAGARVDQWKAALNEPIPVLDEAGGRQVKPWWEPDPNAPLVWKADPNVMEAELLRRLAFSGTDPSPKAIERFITKYESAIDRVPGLRAKLTDYETARAGVYAMEGKITAGSAEEISAALKAGATIDDIEHAYSVKLNMLRESQQNNSATELLGKDRVLAAQEFLDLARSQPGKAQTRANEIDSILSRDKTGQALAGFRGALFRAIEDAATPTPPIAVKEGAVPRLLGVNPQRLSQVVEELQPFLDKFWSPAQIQYLDDWIKGTQLADIDPPMRGGGEAPGTVLGGLKTAGTVEAVGAAGRMAGQAGFGKFLGINTLAAASTGRRLAVTTFSIAGESKILALVEKAMREPDFMAELIKHFKDLPQYVAPEKMASGAKKMKALASGVKEDPRAAFKKSKEAAAQVASLATGKVGKYLYDYSLDKLRRAAQFGLLPVSEATTRIDLETDYGMGRPFLYPENDRRWKMENPAPAESKKPISVDQKDQDERAARAEKQRLEWIKRSTVPSPSASLSMPQANPASVLGQVNPFGGSQFAAAAPQGTSQPDTVARMEQVGLPLFTAAKGGIVSIKPKKPRQMVL